MIRRKDSRDEFALTEREIAVLRGSNVPDEVKQFAARSHDTIGDRITAYQKIAAAARAERIALQEIRKLALTREAVLSPSEWQFQVDALKRQNALLVESVETAREQLMRTTAVPAMAVHSDD